eukprot:gene9523-biopygen179
MPSKKHVFFHNPVVVVVVVAAAARDLPLPQTVSGSTGTAIPLALVVAVAVRWTWWSRRAGASVVRWRRLVLPALAPRGAGSQRRQHQCGGASGSALLLAPGW